ncbi:hypothetical protein, partial [Mesorhizobium sp. M4A.F.Ca.ET.050.02.1.1]|uniref:hypothetical protein n=1 Tax=Mesorhizobium sp. M4A.F.Ca.ET.050.02.1.1 TaxID=2496754 RepID=UPI001FE1CED6
MPLNGSDGGPQGFGVCEFIAFETTGVTHRPALTLDSAQGALSNRLAEDQARAFVAAIDVRRSRSRVTPFASHEPMRRNVLDDQEDHFPRQATTYWKLKYSAGGYCDPSVAGTFACAAGLTPPVAMLS